MRPHAKFITKDVSEFHLKSVSLPVFFSNSYSTQGEENSTSWIYPDLFRHGHLQWDWCGLQHLKEPVTVRYITVLFVQQKCYPPSKTGCQLIKRSMVEYLLASYWLWLILKQHHSATALALLQTSGPRVWQSHHKTFFQLQEWKVSARINRNNPFYSSHMGILKLTIIVWKDF